MHCAVIEDSMASLSFQTGVQKNEEKVHCSLIMHVLHNRKYLILCSNLEQYLVLIFLQPFPLEGL